MKAGAWPSRGLGGAGLLATLLLGLAGCTSAPSTGEAPAAPRPAGGTAPSLPPLGSEADLRRSPNAAFERRQLERAEAATQQGRLAEAALAYEALTLLRPDRPEYWNRLDATRRHIDAAVAERLPRAAAAAQRGDTDEAAQAYLGILALEPGHAGAAKALREMERARNERNHLGKYTRNTLTRRAMLEAEMREPDAQPQPPAAAQAAPPTAPRPPASPAARNDVEHASMLAGQGELDAAIALLDKGLARHIRNRSARVLLADLYFQRASKRRTADRAGALADLQRSTRLDPRHRGAAALLRDLKVPQAEAGDKATTAKTSPVPAAPKAAVKPVAGSTKP
jgi:tetratricopeptide (TPR) repeat protein